MLLSAIDFLFMLKKSLAPAVWLYTFVQSSRSSAIRAPIPVSTFESSSRSTKIALDSVALLHKFYLAILQIGVNEDSPFCEKSEWKSSIKCFLFIYFSVVKVQA